MAEIDIRSLTVAAASLKRICDEYQEKERMLAVFRTAARTLEVMAAAESIHADNVTRERKMEATLRELSDRIEKAKIFLQNTVEECTSQRLTAEEATAAVLAEEGEKQRKHKERMEALDREYQEALQRHAAALEKLKVELVSREEALSAIKKQIAQFQSLAG